MAVSLKRIVKDENNKSIGEGTGVVGEGSLFVASGDDRILQEDWSTGVGILTVNCTDTNSSGVLTVNLPDSVGNRQDDHLELDENNDVTYKITQFLEIDNNGDVTFKT